MSNEVWESVELDVYWMSYEVSNLGRVRRLKNDGSFYYLAMAKAPNGYRTVCLSAGGKMKGISVHRLVALTFLEPPTDKQRNEVNHKNGNKSDNRVENLEWCTRKENLEHAVKTGLSNQKGENHPRATLMEEEVIEIREAYAKGAKRGVLAKKYNVSATTIKRVVIGEVYKNVGGSITHRAKGVIPKVPFEKIWEYHIGGFSHREIAEKLDMNHYTVKSRINQYKAKLKDS